MFEQMLQVVKEHFADHPELTSGLPAEQADNLHREVASQLTDHLQNQPAPANGFGGILNSVESAMGSGGLLTNAITGGLAGSLASKFGLSPVITGAIAATLPTLIQKFANRNA
jgi:hypothetical protein